MQKINHKVTQSINVLNALNGENVKTNPFIFEIRFLKKKHFQKRHKSDDLKHFYRILISN